MLLVLGLGHLALIFEDTTEFSPMQGSRVYRSVILGEITITKSEMDWRHASHSGKLKEVIDIPYTKIINV